MMDVGSAFYVSIWRMKTWFEYRDERRKGLWRVWVCGERVFKHEGEFLVKYSLGRI